MGSPEAFYALCDHRDVLNVRAGHPRPISTCRHRPPRRSDLDISTSPSQSKSLFDCGSLRIPYKTTNLAHNSQRSWWKSVLREQSTIKSKTVSLRRARRGGKAGIERRISWAPEQRYIGCVRDPASQNLRVAGAGPFCFCTPARGP